LLPQSPEVVDMKKSAAVKILSKARCLFLRKEQSTWFDNVNVRIGKQGRFHDIHDVRMRVNGQSGQAMNAANEFAIPARIVRTPSPTLNREEVAAAEFGTTKRSGLRHRSPEPAAVAGGSFSIPQPGEIELRIIRIWIVNHRGKRNERDCRSSNQQ